MSSKSLVVQPAAKAVASHSAHNVAAPKPAKMIAALRSVLNQDDDAQLHRGLVESIKLLGQLVPVVMDGKDVIDGVRRIDACRELGIPPKSVQLKDLGNGNPNARDVWLSLDVCRKHLTQNERALIAVKIIASERPKGLTQEVICKNFAISEDTVQRVREALALGDELGLGDEPVNRLRNGDSPRNVLRGLQGDRIARQNLVTHTEANRKATHDLRNLVAEGKQFSFLYADPPWAEAIAHPPYDTMPTGREGDVPNADGSFPSICAMGPVVKELAAKDAVLWLWTTSSLLQNGLQVMEAWGFRYATMLIWAKSNSNPTKGAVKPRHELVLVGKMRQEDGPDLGADQDIVLVAKRGTGLGTPKRRIEHEDGSHTVDLLQIDSVVELPDRNRAVHSQKPDGFAELAESLYPTQAKLELFGRRQREGWEVWGNQADGKALADEAEAKHRQSGHNRDATSRGESAHRNDRKAKRNGPRPKPGKHTVKASKPTRRRHDTPKR